MAYVEPEVWYQRVANLLRRGRGAGHRRAGRVLLVKVNYRDEWTLPGGVMDAGETPEAARERVVLEEVGLTMPAGPTPRRGLGARVRQTPRPFIYFLFDCGTIASDQRIKLQPDQVARRVAEHVAARIPAAMQANRDGTTIYLPMHTTVHHK
jgi:ADP-ribose pyrophosphatase YjhB (NUDIX family)